MRRFRGIVQSNKEPKDKEILWYYKGELLFFNNGEWQPFLKLILDSDSITGDYISTKDLNEALKKYLTIDKGNQDYQPKGNYAKEEDLDKYQPKGDYIKVNDLYIDVTSFTDEAYDLSVGSVTINTPDYYSIGDAVPPFLKIKMESEEEDYDILLPLSKLGYIPLDNKTGASIVYTYGPFSFFSWGKDPCIITADVYLTREKTIAKITLNKEHKELSE